MERPRTSRRWLVCLFLVLAQGAPGAPPGGTAGPSAAVAPPRPVSAPEREAVRIATDYLARGPAALAAALTAHAPLRALPEAELLAELEVRAGPIAEARWELKTPTPGGPLGQVVFGVDLASGLDQIVVFEMAAEAGSWRLHTLRTLAEPPPSHASPVEVPPPPTTDRRLLPPSSAFLLALLLGPLAVFLGSRSRRAAMGVGGSAVALALIGAGLTRRLDVHTKPSASSRKAAAERVPRLASLLPLQKSLEKSDTKEAAALASRVSGKEASAVARVWLAQKALLVQQLDEARTQLATFPIDQSPAWVELQRARLAVLERKEVDAALYYQKALASGPAHDGLVLEAIQSFALLGFEAQAREHLARLATLGSRDADAYYTLVRVALETNDLDEAEKRFRVGWSLRPATRGELFASSDLWELLVRPTMYRMLGMEAPAEPTVVADRIGESALTFGEGVEPHLWGQTLWLRAGSGEVWVPGGAPLAPAGTRPGDAGEAIRLEEERILKRVPQLLASSPGPGALLSPHDRREILRAADALERRGRWRDLATLTSGLSGAEEHVPSVLVLRRAEALRRTNRSALALEVLSVHARNPAVVRRGEPMALYQLGEMLVTLGDFDGAIKQIQKAQLKVKGEAAIALTQRMQHIRTEQRLATAYKEHTTTHFSVRYPPERDVRLAQQASRILELERERLQKWIPLESNRNVGVQLLWYDEFKETFAAGADILGLYDGRIRVPLAAVTRWVPPFVSLMTHELAHAMIAEATDDRAPHWFHEGLAQHLEMRRYRPNYIAHYKETGQLLSLPAIEAVLQSFPEPSLVGRAYEEAEWVVGFIEEKYGVAGIQKLLAAFRDGKTSEESFPQALGVTFEAFSQDVFDWSVSSAPKMRICQVMSYEPILAREEAQARGEAARKDSVSIREPEEKRRGEIPASLRSSPLRHD